MTDRDCLAADLMIPYIDAPDAADCALCGEPVRTESVREFADSLIALGWTRLDPAAGKERGSARYDDFSVPMLPPPDPALVGTEYGPVKPAKGMRHGPQCGRLDEERLARALTSYAVAVWMGLITDADTQRGRLVRLAPGFASDFAAAIAKAYREDTDAHD